MQVIKHIIKHIKVQAGMNAPTYAATQKKV